jgi:hypothetical protein
MVLRRRPDIGARLLLLREMYRIAVYNERSPLADRRLSTSPYLFHKKLDNMHAEVVWRMLTEGVLEAFLNHHVLFPSLIYCSLTSWIPHDTRTGQ